jgi:hypothetical protein
MQAGACPIKLFTVVIYALRYVVLPRWQKNYKLALFIAVIKAKDK